MDTRNNQAGHNKMCFLWLKNLWTAKPFAKQNKDEWFPIPVFDGSKLSAIKHGNGQSGIYYILWHVFPMKLLFRGECLLPYLPEGSESSCSTLRFIWCLQRNSPAHASRLPLHWNWRFYLIMRTKRGTGWWARATPLKNISQLGWWQKPNINGKIQKMATKPPTSVKMADSHHQNQNHTSKSQYTWPVCPRSFVGWFSKTWGEHGRKVPSGKPTVCYWTWP